MNFHLAVGPFPLCDMGSIYTPYQCGHASRASADAELARILAGGPSAARVVQGACKNEPKPIDVTSFQCPLCGQVITDGKPCGCGARRVA